MSFQGQATDEAENMGFELLDIVYRNMYLLVHMSFVIAIDHCLLIHSALTVSLTLHNM